MAEKYYNLSPYAYCANNPVNFVDPDGRRPIYSTDGYLLGTDDEGLQGDAIIMDSQNFLQGMSSDDALQYNLGVEGLINQDAISRFNESFYSLSSRPDWDGKLTLAEANEWYRNGSGQPLFVSLNKIDLSRQLSYNDTNIAGQERLVNLFVKSNSINDALVYGTITLVSYPNHRVKARFDTYNFDIKPNESISLISRNFLTRVGKIFAGSGKGYKIHIYGSKTLKTAR